MLWEVVENNFVEEPKDNDGIGLQMFGFNVCGGDKRWEGKK